MKELCTFCRYRAEILLLHQAKISQLNTSLGLLNILVHAGQVLVNPTNYSV